MGFLVQRPQIEDSTGPRLEDRKILDSSYGIAIQRGFGTIRVAGNVIHGDELSEQVTVERIDTGGKGGKGRAPTNTNYSYFATFAVSLGFGIVDSILRIWFDGTIVYDVKNQSVSRPIAFTLYKGTETQDPDPVLQTINPDVPGYRGQAYVVFDRLSLEETGRKIPNITFEVVYSEIGSAAISQTTTVDLETISEYSPDTMNENRLAVDWQRDILYIGTSGAKIVAINLSDMSVLRVLPDPGVGRLNGISLIDGSLIISSTVFGGENSRVDQYTGKVLTTSNYNTALEYMIGYAASIFTVGALGINEAFLARQANSSVPELGLFDGVTLEPIENPIFTGTSGYSHLHHCAGYPGEGVAYAGFVSSSNILIYRFDTSFEVDSDGIGYIGSGSSTLLATITPSSINSAWTGFSTQSMASFDEVDDGVGFYFDFTDGTILTAAADTGGTGETRAFKFDPVTATILWVSEPLANAWPGAGNQVLSAHLLTGRYFGWTTSLSNDSNQRWTQIDLRTGVIDDYYDGTPQGVNFGYGPHVWDGDRQASFHVQGSAIKDHVRRNFVGIRDSQNATVASIISFYCEQAGLTPSQYNVSAVTDTVAGFLVAEADSPAENLKDLLKILHIDSTEIDGVLTFVPRADTVDWTISQNEFVRTRKKDLYKEPRTRERDLPVRLELTAKSEARDYENNTQGAERSTFPNAVVRSKKIEELDIPAVMTDNDIRRACEKLLFTSWIERDELEFTLSKKYLGVTPTDVMTVTLDDGSIRNFRASEVNIGKNLSVSVEAVRQISGQYNSTVLADAGQAPLRNSRIKGINPQIFILDTPLLRDEDSIDNTGFRSYYAGSYYGNLTFNGAAMFKSPDAVSWSQIGIIPNEVTWGVTENSLGVPDSPWRWDNTNTLTVRLVVGSIASDTEINVLNGSNPALIIQSNGDVELIQFMTATATSTTNQYILSNLIRGRRGTDTMMANHGVGDKIIFLSENTIRTMRLDLTRIGQSTFFKGVTAGMLFEDSLPISKTLNARDQMPYAPRNSRAEFNGSDIDITWIRRGRIGGELIDGTDTVPLSETLEQYEIDIYNNAGTTILRTLVINDAQTATYTSAQQTTDSWDGSTHIKVAIYQMSSIVGRGFGELVTLEIN
jgi:hypothetical protein